MTSTTAGATNVSHYAYFVDDDGGTAPGEPTTGKLFSDIETGGSASYVRQGEARVDFTLITLASASTAHADGGFILVDDTNMPGLYRVDVPDAAFAAGADFVIIQMVMAAANNSIMRPLLVMLPDVDFGDTVRAGLTALPNAAADAAGGLPISDLGGLDLDAMNTNINDIETDTADMQPRVVAIEVDTDTTLPGLIATAQADLDIITGAAGALLDSTATSAQLVDDVWDEILTGATHNIATSAGRRLRGIQEFQGYEDGAIWIDTVNGSAGTIDFENGTVENPVNGMADANTLAASLGIANFRVLPGSTITFAAAQNNQFFDGVNWTLALGGQQIVGSMIHGATVSGIAAGVGAMQMFRNCTLNAITHIKGTHCIGCAVAGTQTVGEAGDYFFDQCHSAVAGTATWVFEFGNAIGNTNFNMRHYSGGVQLESMGDTGTDTASIEGHGQIIEGTCAGGTVAVRGHFTLSGITNITMSDDARYDMAQVGSAVWDEDATGHQTGGTFGQAIGDPGANTETMYDAVVTDAVGTNVAADIATAQSDLDILTGADGATLASAQGPVTFTGVTNEAGLTLIGAGTGPGLSSTGGATGHGIASVGGATSGDGVNAAANGDGNGMDMIGVGANAGLRTAGGATGPGIHAHGGATGATPGVEFHAHSATGDALELEADGSGDSNADLAAILVDTGTTLPAQISALNDVSTAQVNAEMVDVMDTDTITLPGQTAPPLAPTHRQAIAWLYKVFRNRKTQTATAWNLLADDETTVDAKATVSDVGGLATKTEISSGP